MDKQVNLTINFPDAESLTNYCLATGWDKDGTVTKRDWVKSVIIRQIKETLGNLERQKIELERSQKIQLLNTTMDNLLIN